MTQKIREVDKQYPSAVLLKDSCRENYDELLDAYNKIYDRVGILFAYCGVMTPGIMAQFLAEFSVLQSTQLSFTEIISVIIALISTLIFIFDILRLGMLMCSRKIKTFDARSIRNAAIYQLTEEEASLWLIEKYAEAIDEIRETVQAKQRKFDAAIFIALIATIFYAGAIVL